MQTKHGMLLCAMPIQSTDVACWVPTPRRPAIQVGHKNGNEPRLHDASCHVPRRRGSENKQARGRMISRTWLPPFEVQHRKHVTACRQYQACTKQCMHKVPHSSLNAHHKGPNMPTIACGHYPSVSRQESASTWHKQGQQRTNPPPAQRGVAQALTRAVLAQT